MKEEHKPQVFISYSHSEDDSAWTKRLAEELQKKDLLTWIDEWNIKPGESIADAINKGLRESQFLVFVLSSEDVAPSVFFELGAAVAMGKKIIPIISKDVDYTALPIPLRHRRFLIRKEPEEAASEIAKAVMAVENDF